MKNLFLIIVVFNLVQTLGQYSISAGIHAERFLPLIRMRNCSAKINVERFLPSVGMTNSPLGVKDKRFLPSVGMTSSPLGVKDKRFLPSVGMTISTLGIKDKTMAASPPLFYPHYLGQACHSDCKEESQSPQKQKSFQQAMQGGISITTETEVIPTDSARRNPNHFRDRSHRTMGRISLTKNENI